MVRNWLLKILLLPFALLYGLGVALRDLFYKFGLLKSVEFNVPVISIGNISIGGTGKTPHIEYLITGLREHIKVATLSRGYGRKTKGYLAIDPRMSADKAGDEPLQFKRKYPDIPVVVAESRTFGIVQMLQNYPELQCILLDDAFQHRSVQPGLNILLTSHNEPYYRDFVLPVGRLREWPAGAKRADAIIVTKCPLDWDRSKRDAILEKINPRDHQRVFFSRFKYHYPYSIFNPQQRIEIGNNRDILVLSAIANTNYMMDFLQHFDNTYHEMSFTDHHMFTVNEISQIVQKFEYLSSEQKMILTTEKDAVRLEPHLKYLHEKNIPVFVLPVSVEFLDGDKERFDDYVKEFLLNFTV